MLRHVISPAHSYAQIPNAILRHPKLSADAKTLLTWQLSLPAGAKQSLSETARKAGIKKVAFQNAKGQLLKLGYLHEWRVRLDSGRCTTVQLVSNEPLSAKEALAVRDGLRPAPSGHRQPTAARPTAGQPTGRPACRQPRKDPEENTSPPTTPVPGEQLLRSLGQRDRRLAMPARTARRWAPLAAAWLGSGLPTELIQRTLSDGLGDARNPLGVLRWRLEHAVPDAVDAGAEPASEAASAPPPTPRPLGMRECRTRHTQPRLFVPRPGHDDGLCPDCRSSSRPSPAPGGPGYAEFLAARRATRTRPSVHEVRVTAAPAHRLDPQAIRDGEDEG